MILMKQRLFIIILLLCMIHQGIIFFRDIDGGGNLFYRERNGHLLSEFDNELNVSVIDLNGLWNFTPVGLPQMTIEVPSFYVWKVNCGPVFDTSVPGSWKIVEGYVEVDLSIDPHV